MRRGIHARRHQAGLTMVEVLIALLVLGVGVMGLAMMQTLNLRYTQSANHRTQAVNLAGELIDMMRTNRSQLAAYEFAKVDLSSMDEAKFKTGCQPPAVLNPANNIARWQCEVRESLGAGAEVQSEVDIATNIVTVTVAWDESNIASKITGSNKVELVSQL